LPKSNLKKRAGGAARILGRPVGESLAERPPLDTVELHAALGFRLRKAWTAMECYFLECFREEKVTPATYAVLVLVAANPGCLAAEICAVTSISSANIIPYIDELVDRGLIRREVGARDRRVKHLHLTEAGALRLEAWRRLEKRVMEHFRKKLGPQNLPKFMDYLGTVAEKD
jgi:DNA-binding MarR family transcriptional regulator